LKTLDSAPILPNSSGSSGGGDGSSGGGDGKKGLLGFDFQPPNINKDGNPFTKNTRHVKANVNT